MMFKRKICWDAICAQKQYLFNGAGVNQKIMIHWTLSVSSWCLSLKWCCYFLYNIIFRSHFLPFLFLLNWEMRENSTFLKNFQDFLKVLKISWKLSKFSEFFSSFPENPKMFLKVHCISKSFHRSSKFPASPWVWTPAEHEKLSQFFLAVWLDSIMIFLL